MADESLHKEYTLESGKILEIHVEDSPESPREWDNLGIIWTSHRRYNLSDSNAPKIVTDDYEHWEAIEKYLIKEEGARVILPIYMYDHGGISISTTSFNCRWDSGQVGFIYATQQDIKSNYTCKRITKSTLQTVEEILQSEIKIYNQYLIGDVYGFKLMHVDMESKEREEEDACWGFFGENIKKNGILEHLGHEDIILEEL